MGLVRRLSLRRKNSKSSNDGSLQRHPVVFSTPPPPRSRKHADSFTSKRRNSSPAVAMTMESDVSSTPSSPTGSLKGIDILDNLDLVRSSGIEESVEEKVIDGSSWPWMKGVRVSIADPIPPVHEHDKRPAVKDLIKEYRDRIDEMKKRLVKNPLYDPTKHDDLWIVRFLISHKKKLDPALKAAEYTLKFREDHNLDVIDIRKYPPPFLPPHELPIKTAGGRRYLSHLDDDAARFTIPHPQMGVVVVFRVAGLNQRSLVKEDKSIWLESYVFLTEFTHQWLDYQTRTTGRLTKSVRLADFTDAENTLDPQCMKNDAGAILAMENCYPQLLQSQVICNPSTFVYYTWQFFKPFIPKRVIEKLNFVQPLKSERDRQWILQFVLEEHLPERFGGKNKVWPMDFPYPFQNIGDADTAETVASDLEENVMQEKSPFSDKITAPLRRSSLLSGSWLEDGPTLLDELSNVDGSQG